MKTIVLNGSTRKDWNTATMLKEAQKGAESVGAETEYLDLFDLTYTGCRSRIQMNNLKKNAFFFAVLSCTYSDYNSRQFLNIVRILC